MEGDVALNLLHHLVNVPIEHGDRAEALEDCESLCTILGPPAPFGVNGPERNVREDDDRCASAKVGNVLGEPFQLRSADHTEAFQLDAVIETDEMHALVVKALPGFAGGRFAEALEKQFAVIASDIVFAWDIEHFLLAKTPEDLVQGIKLGGSRKMGEVASVKNQVRLVDGGVDLIDGQLQGAVDVGIRRLIKPYVAVADLDESEVDGFGLVCLGAEQARTGYAAGERPDYGGSSPPHTLQKAAAVHFHVELGSHACLSILLVARINSRPDAALLLLEI